MSDKMSDDAQAAGPTSNGHKPVEQIILDGSFLPASFRAKSLEVARDVCYFICRGADYGPAPNKACKIMRELVHDTLKHRASMMHRLARKLEIRERDQLHLLEDIATDMFNDQQVNWGRIVTFHAFCCYLAKDCEHTSLPDCALDVAEILSSVTVNRLGLWIVTHGGWAFEAQFPPVYMWSTGGFLKALLVLGILVGAILAFYSGSNSLGVTVPV